MEMPQETLLALISLVEKERCLWDPSDVHYKNRNMQQDAWEFISQSLEAPPSMLQEEWRSLHGSYRHYRRAYENSLVTGTDSADVCRPEWFAYNAMAFLHSMPLNTYEANTLQPTTTIDTTPMPPRTTTPVTLSIAAEPEFVNETSQQPSPPSTPPQNASAAPKRHWHEANEEVLVTLRNVAQVSQELISAGQENRLAPLYAGMRDWSPVRQEAMLVNIQCLLAEENVARFVAKHGYDPRN